MKKQTLASVTAAVISNPSRRTESGNAMNLPSATGFSLTRIPLSVAMAIGSTRKPSIFISRRTRLAAPSAIDLRGTVSLAVISFLWIDASDEHVDKLFGQLQIIGT